MGDDRWDMAYDLAWTPWCFDKRFSLNSIVSLVKQAQPTALRCVSDLAFLATGQGTDYRKSGEKVGTDRYWDVLMYTPQHLNLSGVANQALAMSSSNAFSILPSPRLFTKYDLREEVAIRTLLFR